MDRRDYPPNAIFDRIDIRRMRGFAEDDEGNELEFPLKLEVCGTCDGKGTHVNPSIDSHGIGAEEWAEDWDEDEREGYMNGRYDVQCSECNGERVVPVLDEDRATEAQRKFIEDKQRADYTARTERASEARYGY